MREIFSRRSIRQFTDEKISKEDLMHIIKAGMNAPSGKNRQPWQFYILKNPEKIDALKSIGRFWQPLESAPQVIIICGDLGIFSDPYYHFINCAAAVQNMLLTIEEMGYGACWLGIAPNLNDCDKVRSLLALPREHLPIFMVALGGKSKEKSANDRFLDERIHLL